MKVQRYIIGFIVVLVLFGYALFWGFRLMNMPRDDAYIGGIFLVVFTLVVVGSILVRYVKKITNIIKSKENVNDKSNDGDGNTVKSNSNSRMHN